VCLPNHRTKLTLISNVRPLANVRVQSLYRVSRRTLSCPCQLVFPGVSTANVRHLVNQYLSPHRHSIRSIPLPSHISPGGSSHSPYNGSNIVQGYHKERINVCIQGTFSRTLLAITPSTDVERTGKRPRDISMLSDDILLEIFDFCSSISSFYDSEDVWDWHILVHVCQRWRQVVFDSPLRLNLQLRCTNGTPVRKNLDIWPNLPIIIDYYKGIDEDDVIAALEHPHRVSFVRLRLTGPQLEKMATVMQEPFPALKRLILLTRIWNGVPILPCEFLGRSAPCLRTIELDGIPFSSLPALLLSTNDLVRLQLLRIPQTGYISPEAMVAGLATLTRLEYLDIEFQSPASRPDRIRLPPVTRTVLPALTMFEFRGVREYLEDFVARINTPRLFWISASCFNQLVDFEVPQLWQFIDHSEDLSQNTRCCLQFRHDRVSFGAGPTTHILESKSFEDFARCIDVNISCEGIDWQVSHIAQALNQTAVLSNMLHLAIDFYGISPEPEDMDDIEWLQLLRPFSSIQTLFVSSNFARHISRALEDIAVVMATEVLPALDMLCLEDQPVSSDHKFIAARWESGRPVTTVNTRKVFEERQVSY